MAINKIERKKRIHYRIRKVVNGTAQKPRMCVFRSNCQIYVQLIDDVNGVTLAAAASNERLKGVHNKQNVLFAATAANSLAILTTQQPGVSIQHKNCADNLFQVGAVAN